MNIPFMQHTGLGRVGRTYFRIIIAAVLCLLVFYLTASLSRSPVKTDFTSSRGDRPQTTNRNQLIANLISDGDAMFHRLLSKQSRTLKQASAAYRARRGRHPPPGFDKGFEYAQADDAVIVEEFWDQIYHDLEPFWAISPAQIRSQARALDMTLGVKEGKVLLLNNDWFWLVVWRNMIDEVAYMLPDMVIPMNPVDEPRIMVPWETVSGYVVRAAATKVILPADEVHSRITGWRSDSIEAVDMPAIKWFNTPPYTFARQACSPDAPIRKDYMLYNSGQVPHEPQFHGEILHPFVINSTLSSDVCQDSAIAAYHAALISPQTASTSQVLQPLFGGSKFAVNNEIILPAPMYWDGDERFEMSDSIPWSKKKDTAIWRGTANGGRHNAFNWPHFHRHRLVALANGTKYTKSDPQHDRIFTPAQRAAAIDSLPSQIQNNLGQWLDSINDVAFVDLFCDDTYARETHGQCWYTDSEFIVAPQVSLAQQYNSKYLPDVDGNSFSGRYRSFLYSNSLPIKTALYREWHDSRLIAWKHFVPMNNRFTDYYSLLAYFIGCDAETCGAEVSLKDTTKRRKRLLRLVLSGRGKC